MTTEGVCDGLAAMLMELALESQWIGDVDVDGESTTTEEGGSGSGDGGLQSKRKMRWAAKICETLGHVGGGRKEEGWRR